MPKEDNCGEVKLHVQKMINDLQYDKQENERLRFDINHLLETDTFTCNKKTLIYVNYRDIIILHLGG